MLNIRHHDASNFVTPLFKIALTIRIFCTPIWILEFLVLWGVSCPFCEIAPENVFFEWQGHFNVILKQHWRSFYFLCIFYTFIHQGENVHLAVFLGIVLCFCLVVATASGIEVGIPFSAGSLLRYRKITDFQFLKIYIFWVCIFVGMCMRV